MHPHTLTPEDIAEMCKHAKDLSGKSLAKHAEKWIQLKWKLSNWPLDRHSVWMTERLKYDSSEPLDEIGFTPEMDEPIPYIRGTRYAGPKAWNPEFIPEPMWAAINYGLNTVKASYDEIREAGKLPEIMTTKFARKSFINLDFVVGRLLHMLCEISGNHENGQCFAEKYEWMLKSLKTPHNTRCHVAWWYFLVSHVYNSTLYEPENCRPIARWFICETDPLLEAYKPKCQDLVLIQRNSSPDPALYPIPLPRKRARNSLQQSVRAYRIRTRGASHSPATPPRTCL